MHDDILVLAGDNLLGFRLRDVLAAVEPGCALVAAHDVQDLGRASSFGTIVLGEDGRTVTAFEEKPAHPRSTLISTGCFTLPAPCLPLICEYARSRPDDMGGALEALVQAGKPVHCITPPGAWFDVGTFDAYVDATSSFVGERVLAGNDSAAERCVTHGSVVLGNGSIVRDSQMTDVVVFDRCVIEDCILERCVIDNDCVLRGVDLTGKMLRAGTTLTRGESA
jgi:glucose-1-phosphate thymidylyltransferase